MIGSQIGSFLWKYTFAMIHFTELLKTYILLLKCAFQSFVLNTCFLFYEICGEIHQKSMNEELFYPMLSLMIFPWIFAYTLTDKSCFKLSYIPFSILFMICIKTDFPGLSDIPFFNQQPYTWNIFFVLDYSVTYFCWAFKPAPSGTPTCPCNHHSSLW